MTDPPMYNVASAVFWRSLAIVRSLPLPGCGGGGGRNQIPLIAFHWWADDGLTLNAGLVAL